MSFFFIPPLAQSTTLHLPFHPFDLVFSASLSSHDEYLRTKESGARLELWSDIPTSGITDGQWNALPFNWSQSINSLTLEIPSAAFVHSWKNRFSFTYRLIYPNGHIKWLGDYGNNGNLIIQNDDERFQLCSGWHVDQAVLVFIHHEHTHDLQVARLSDKAEWILWAFQSEGMPRLLSLDDDLLSAKSVLLIPRKSPNAIVPLAPAFLTSQEDTIFAIKRSGIITATGGVPCTKLSLQTLTSSDLRPYGSSFSGSELLESDPSHNTLIFTPPSNPRSLETACLSLISLLPCSLEMQQFRVPLCRIKSSFVSQTPELAIYSDSSAKASFLSTNVDACTLPSGFGGSQWLFTPVYELSSSAGQVRVAVLASHTKVTEPAHIHRLPTPPPSPLISCSQLNLPHLPNPLLNIVGEGASTAVVRTSPELQVRKTPTLTWRLSCLIMNLFLWFLITFLERLLALKAVPPSTDYSDAILSIPVQSKSSSASSAHTGTSSGDGQSNVELENHTVEHEKSNINTASGEAVEENEENAQQSPTLAVDLRGGKERIRLLVGGKEQDVIELTFTVDGNKITVASMVKVADDDDNIWLVELAGGSGRLVIQMR